MKSLSRSRCWCRLALGFILVAAANVGSTAHVDEAVKSRSGKHLGNPAREPERVRRATEEEAREFLTQYGVDAERVYSTSAFASWAYSTNLTDENSAKEVEASIAAAAFTKSAAVEARGFDADVDSFAEDVQRQLNFISDTGVAALDDQTVEEYNQIMADMNRIYSTGQACRNTSGQTECMYLDPGLEEIMATSTDYDELVWAWKGFRDAVGIPNKPLYQRYVEISNEGARANGYEDLGDDWRSSYADGDSDFIEQVYDLYYDILPLYKELHAYVRLRLMSIYGTDIISPEGHLPACVLGDMWGRFWGNIYPRVVPYPDQPNIDVTDAMKEQNYTVMQMFEMGDEFFTSMGLLPVNDAFWEHSLLEQPTDGRQVVCHPSAWDFSNGEDFRIKMCTKVNMDNFLTVHHELGHIQYFMQYADQPISFRDGANGAFHEAIGEVMSQSVATPKHLAEVGLFDGSLDSGDEVSETDINFLLKMSLTTIGTIPFSLALEQWRWDAFADESLTAEGMARWWQLKNELIGVDAPVDWSDTDFHPGAMYHIIIGYPFIGYYIRTIIQFQFYQALCDAADHTGPLHKCDFYRSQEAGTKLANMLAMGKSRPWPEAMEAITGQRAMKADAILRYFEPLTAWLKEYNREHNAYVGWPGARDPPTERPATTEYTGSGMLSASPSLTLIIISACLKFIGLLYTPSYF